MGAESLREPLAGKVLFSEKMNVREAVFSRRLLLFYGIGFLSPRSSGYWSPKSRNRGIKIIKYSNASLIFN
jgi:hypothetical protein